eukprot:CAMPEP_0118703656 /NCGR_PEP_ID=MMETSP0800-20121206/18704_1 /TAXON_ID=210618 ORGANISM="Striatella unipunctata, Strain CCMP2910" /NCGR_SAMPLE_ID=MMETSP0800 /ASSEMBLY_ACC=CAM_ASM_000638 /LENGTH=361 /DNA_ID=CAMNT_0006605265 /DNA_START=234 /DNA_END=1319 /DNA_ORIENTATION=-
MSIFDGISNVVLPIVLIVAGALVILLQDGFIEAVLNSTALLFVLEIDDMLPTILDLDGVSIVRNYLIKECLDEFKVVMATIENDQRKQTNVQTMMRRLESAGVEPIEFSDMLLTNAKESGNDIPGTSTFAPYQVLRSDDKNETESLDISNSNFITRHCLLKRIEWAYTIGFPTSTDARIGYLKMWKLGEEEPYEVIEKGLRGESYQKSAEEPKVDITCTHQPTEDKFHLNLVEIMENYNKIDDPSKEDKEKMRKNVDRLNQTYSIHGVFMITAFEMSEAVLKLRVCGSKTPQGFADAMDYYSMWDLDTSAARLLREKQPLYDRLEENGIGRLGSVSKLEQTPEMEGPKEIDDDEYGEHKGV